MADRVVTIKADEVSTGDEIHVDGRFCDVLEASHGWSPPNLGGGGIAPPNHEDSIKMIALRVNGRGDQWLLLTPGFPVTLRFPTRDR
jgi:hypothetical protein